jgi:hypothetical protein
MPNVQNLLWCDAQTRETSVARGIRKILAGARRADVERMPRQHTLVVTEDGYEILTLP